MMFRVLKVLKTILSHPLNRNATGKALVRFIHWQLSSRIYKGYFIYDWIQNSKFMVKSGDTGLTGNIYCGLQEFLDMSYLLHVLRENDLFVDVGANLGSYTILASGVAGANCICFEPIPSTFARLEKNIAINSIEGKVTPLQKAAGEKSAQLAMTSSLDTTNHVMSKNEANLSDGLTVEAVTLDEVLKDKAPSLIKIDTEGFELPALLGAQEILKKPSLHSIIIELNESGSRYGFQESKILELLDRNGFKPYAYDPFTRTITPLQSKNTAHNNTIFIRNAAYVADRINSARKFKVGDAEI